MIFLRITPVIYTGIPLGMPLDISSEIVGNPSEFTRAIYPVSLLEVSTEITYGFSSDIPVGLHPAIPAEI